MKKIFEWIKAKLNIRSVVRRFCDYTKILWQEHIWDILFIILMMVLVIEYNSKIPTCILIVLFVFLNKDRKISDELASERDKLYRLMIEQIKQK